jgi:hypothetical protein
MRRFAAFALATAVLGCVALTASTRPVSAVQPCWSQAQVDTTNDNHGDLGGPDLRFAGLQLDCAQLTWKPSFAFNGSAPAANTTAPMFVDTDSNPATGCAGADLILDVQWGAGGSVQSILGRHAASCSVITTLGLRRIDTFPEGWIGSPTFDWQLDAQGDLMPNQGWYHVADGVPHEGSSLFTISPVSIHRFYKLIVSGDFNGDGVDDILFYVPYAKNSTQPLWSGQPGGEFTRGSLTVAGVWAHIVVGDFNGDGVDDLLFFAPYGAGSVQPLWLGQHGGGFVHTSIAIPVCYGFVAVGDFNGDGVDDLFCYDGAHHGTLSSLHANAQPDTQSFTFAGTYNTIAASDFDGDGRADILFRNSAHDVNYVWYGNANETFTSKAMALHTTAFNVVVGDFDGDGRADLILWRAGVGPDVLRLGAAARSFGSGPQVRIDYEYGWVVPGDYDANGKSDLLAVGDAWVLPTLWTAN